MKKWYSFKMLGVSSAEITIYADIGMWGVTAQQFKTDLDSLVNITDLTIRINSYGGEVFDGNAIHNLLVEHTASKTVIIDGVAASIASVIAMAADPGKIVMPENAFLMIHDPTVGVVGNSEDLRRNADLLDAIKKNAIKAYQRHAKDLTDDELWDLMKNETWINAADAKTYGFIGDISDSVDAIEPVTNTGRIAPESVKKALCKYKPNGQEKPTNKGESMLTCKHCNGEMAVGAVFCNHCGKPVNDANRVTDAHKREIEEAARESERSRVLDISSRCDKFGLSAEFKNELIKGNVPTDQAVAKILEKVAENFTAVPPQAIVKKDEADKFRMQATQSLQVAVGLEKDAAIVNDVRKNGGPRDLHSLTRACLIQEGRLTSNQVSNLGPQDLAHHAIRMAGSAVGTSDLPSILADTMNKSFIAGMENTPATFQQWVKETENTDFRGKSLVKLSSFGDVDDLPEGMPFKAGKFSDKKETVTVSTKGKKLSITRQVIVNNDTDAINAIPMLMGAALRRRQNKDAYDLLAYNSLVGPVMTEDSIDLFNSAHSNLKTSSGIVSVSSLGTAEQMLMDMPLQKGSTDQTSVAYSGATAKYLITGTANRIAILQLLGASTVAFDVAGTATVKPNPYAGNYITPVFDPYLQSLLTAGSAGNAWYLAADQMQMGSLVIAYLSGNRTPTLRSEPSGVGDALGIEWDIFYDWGFAFEDHRGIIYNDGK